MLVGRLVAVEVDALVGGVMRLLVVGGAAATDCWDCRAWHQCCCELVELNTILMTLPPELKVTEKALRPLSLATTDRVVGIVKIRVSVFSEPSLMKNATCSVSVAEYLCVWCE